MKTTNIFKLAICGGTLSLALCGSFLPVHAAFPVERAK